MLHQQYKKAAKCKKNLPKHLFLLSSAKTTGIFLQIFVAFSEKLDFSSINMIYLLLTHVSINLISVLLFQIFEESLNLRRTFLNFLLVL